MHHHKEYIINPASLTFYFGGGAFKIVFSVIKSKIFFYQYLKIFRNVKNFLLAGIKMNYETAIFGGGCFWCIEAVFLMVRGIAKVETGYSGGHIKTPSYNMVCTGGTGHAEVIKIEFDPKVIRYRQLLEIFFFIHDPTTPGRQGNDIGDQYRSIILFTSKNQEKIAKGLIGALESQKIYPDHIVTELKAYDKFYKAEDYHQEYFESNKFQSYCQLVISPKIEKFKERFGSLLK